MGLFKSKQEKEMERKMLVKKTMRNIEKYITQLQGQKEKAIESAKQAKIQGSPQQYSLAVSALKTALSQEKKAKEMLLNFELTLQMRDLAQMTSSFLDGMSVLSVEMKKITCDMNFAKVQKQFTQAMQGVEETTENIDAMLDNTDMSFSSISSNNANISNDEIERMINFQASNNENDLDSDIDKKLNELSKSLQ
jgi:predicted O-linked N-acetylglucosamine transferase (SPINDLY family)